MWPEYASSLSLSVVEQIEKKKLLKLTNKRKQNPEEREESYRHSLNLWIQSPTGLPNNFFKLISCLIQRKKAL